MTMRISHATFFMLPLLLPSFSSISSSLTVWLLLPLVGDVLLTFATNVVVTAAVVSFVQVLPSPEYPDIHAHVNDPSVSVQTALLWQSPASRLHSFSFVQVLPSPEYPDSHAHVNDPSVSVQTALSWQSSTSRLHSFLFVQVLPSPEYPDSHAHVNDPSVSVQTALSWQSSTSR